MKSYSQELMAAFRHNVRLEEVPDRDFKELTMTYGLTPMLPMHLGFDPVIATLRFFEEKGFKIKLIFGDTYLKMEDKLQMDAKEYKNVCDYYKYIFKASGLKHAEFILHSEATANSRYWFLLANLANDMSLRNVYQSLPAQYRDQAIPLAKSLHTLMQTADVEFFNASYVLGSLTQERIYFVSRDLLRKNKLPVPGVILISEINDLFGNTLKESSSKSRLSFHENEVSLRKKLEQLDIKDTNILLSLFLNSILPYGKVEFRGKIMSPEVLIELIQNLDKDMFEEMIEVIYNKLLARLNILNQGFKRNPKLIEWIDLDRVRAIGQK
jgi:hypothetical protein